MLLTAFVMGLRKFVRMDTSTLATEEKLTSATWSVALSK